MLCRILKKLGSVIEHLSCRNTGGNVKEIYLSIHGYLYFSICSFMSTFSIMTTQAKNMI